MTLIECMCINMSPIVPLAIGRAMRVLNRLCNFLHVADIIIGLSVFTVFGDIVSQILDIDRPISPIVKLQLDPF